MFLLENFSPKIKKEGTSTYILDIIRKKYLVFTPEELVRQYFLHFLIYHKGFSKSLITVERGTNYHTLTKRTDIIVYDRNGQPFLLVECKAESVPLTQQVVEQASRYNLSIKAPYLCITNGRETFCFQIDFKNNKITQLSDIPSPQI